MSQTSFNTRAAVLILLGLQARHVLADRTITVKNNCTFTIWPALFTDPDTNSILPDHATGWEAPQGHTEVVTVRDDWVAGRIWGRTGCSFTGPDATRPEACKSGGCAGGLECVKPRGGTGVRPFTIGEFTLAGNPNSPNDFYDVSLVDGFNLPMMITTTADCPMGSCPKNLNTNCPAELKAGSDGCNSDCNLVPGTVKDSSICCTGIFVDPAKCPASGIPHYNYFKSNCERSYVFAYDEPSLKAVWTCPREKKTNYVLTFCP